MRPPAEDERLMRYLLGTLPDEERDALEAAYFSDGGLFEELQAVEDDLIDAYVADRLSPGDRKSFEGRFLASPARRERVRIARALRSAASDAASPVVAPRPRPLRAARLLGPMAAGVAAAAVAVWALVQVHGLRGALDAAREQQRMLEQQAGAQQSRIAELAAELARARPGLALAAWTLAPGLARDGPGAPRLVLPQGTEWVRLDLLLPEDVHRSYGATLETAEGRRLLTLPGLRAQVASRRAAVPVILPAGLLAEGTYVLTLAGTNREGRTEEIDTYHFRVATGQ